MNKEFKCPECGGDIKVWADIDAEASFKVSETGSLEGLIIKNVFQSDGRCGVECTECKWELNFVDEHPEYPELEKLANDALEWQEKIDYLRPHELEGKND